MQVNVFGMKGRVFTSSDSSIMNEIQPATLDLVDVMNMKTDLASKKTPCSGRGGEKNEYLVMSNGYEQC